MRVDLPSSTEPAVAKRRSSISSRAASEVALALAVLHRSLGEAVVGAGRAAFGQPRDGDLGDDLVVGRRRRLDRAGDRHVADGAVADADPLHLLALARRRVRTDGEPHAVALEDLTLVREVDRRQLDLLVGEVLPDVELGPVAEREDPDVLALVVPAVGEVPELRPLVLGVPLPELVAERVDAL